MREPDRRKMGASSARTSAEWALFAKHPEITVRTAPTQHLAFEAAKRETPLTFSDGRGGMNGRLLAEHVMAQRPELDPLRARWEEARKTGGRPAALAEGTDESARLRAAIHAECRELGVPVPLGDGSDKPADLARYRKVVLSVADKHPELVYSRPSAT